MTHSKYNGIFPCPLDANKGYRPVTILTVIAEVYDPSESTVAKIV
jgi:hypothetical protein